VCSKKDRTFSIKTLFHNILSTAPFKAVPSTGDTSFPTFLPLLECFLERTFCDGAQFSYSIFMNLRVFKKRPYFQIARQPAQRARYGYWAHLAAGFDNKLPFALFRYERQLIRRTASTRAQFSGCSSATNAHSETGQMAVFFLSKPAARCAH
jgi:hypothetical protein